MTETVQEISLMINSYDLTNAEEVDDGDHKLTI